MRIDIFDVGHGQCACVTAPNGRRIMIDCGHRTAPDWRPSRHFAGNGPDVLIVTNLDEDHISDFDDIQRLAPPILIVTNRSVGATQLVAMKPFGMACGTRAFHNWLATPGAAAAIPLPDFAGVTVDWFYNSYPTEFRTTNNLSLVVFVSYAGFTMVFSGDLEHDGWAHLLASKPRVRQLLQGVNVFMCSHHGRENGCSDHVRQFCKPQLFIISDDAMQFETQETTAWYANHAHGARVRRTPRPMGLLGIPQPDTTDRYVVTTRNDKSVRIDVGLDGGWGCEVGIDHTH